MNPGGERRPLIDFRVIGIPKGQPRPRAFSRGGKARVHDPSTAEGWKSAIAQAVQLQMPAQPLACPLHVDIVFYMPRPKSHFRRGRFAGEVKPTAPIHHVQKPDIDNLLKAVFDALTTISLWVDDTTVVSVTASKEWRERGGAAISIFEVEES